MSEAILGITAFDHSSAAAIVYDGEIIAAAQEERFSRQRHDTRFPRRAIEYCLEKAFIEIDEVDAVVFSCHPESIFDRRLRSLLSLAPDGVDPWLDAADHLSGQLLIGKHLRHVLGIEDDIPVLLTQHHLAHAAAAFYPSPFEEAAILTLDGVGERTTTGLAVGRDRTIEMLSEMHHPHSLGLLYGAFTDFCGFAAGRDEAKLMDLAAFGEARYADLIRDHLVEQKADGSFRLDSEQFRFVADRAVLGERAYGLFSGPPRSPQQPIGRREMDLAASIQHVAEEIILSLARHLRQRSGSDHLCLAGDMTLNAVANGVLQRQRIFDRLWIQPAVGDAGTALGAALDACHRHFDNSRRRRDDGRDGQHGSFLGPAITSAEIRAFVDRVGCRHQFVRNLQNRREEIVNALEQGKIVGLFSGPMEFGPHGLGARSILGDARNPEVRRRLRPANDLRQAFRPLPLSILAEKASDYFLLDDESPYKLLAAPLQPERRLAPPPLEPEASAAERLATADQERSAFPAVTHVDFSCRVHTVHASDQEEFHALLTAFEERTGCPMVANVSFRLDDEPMVAAPADAYDCFMRGDIDLLVLEDCLLIKEEQTSDAAPATEKPPEHSKPSAEHLEHLRRFHAQKLVPAATSLKRRGVPWLAPEPSDTAETWYHQPSPESTEITVVTNDGSDDLVRRWRQQGLDELADLMPELLALAKGSE